MKLIANIITYKLFILTILIIGSEAVCDGTSRRSIRIANFTEIALPTYLKANVSINDSKLSFFVETFFTYDRMYADIDLFVRTPESDSFVNFFKKSIDVCALVENPIGNDPLIYFVYQGLLTSNKRNKLFLRCPIKKVINIYKKKL